MNPVENKSGLHPTGDRVLVEPFKVEEKTAGGIVLPMSTQDKEDMAQIMGILLEIGNTAHLCPEMHDIKVGDTVLYAKWAGSSYPIDGVPYRIMRAADVVGKADQVPDFVIRGALSSMQVFGKGDDVDKAA